MNQYYYSADGQTQQGPIYPDDILRLTLPRTTLFWRAGMDSWHMANDIPELSVYHKQMPPPLVIASPPPLPKAQVEYNSQPTVVQPTIVHVPQPQSQNVTVNSKGGATAAAGRMVGRGIGCIIVVILMFMFFAAAVSGVFR